MIGAGFDFSANSGQINTLDAELKIASTRLGQQGTAEATLPIGVGFLMMLTSSDEFVDNLSALLQRHKPCAIWLFCPEPSTPTVHSAIIPRLRDLGSSWGLKIWVQVGSVSAARDAANDGADIIVAQGIDAGGHQWLNGVGIVSIVPEVKDMLRTEFPDREIAVVAAGGIVDGRGVAAALALGE
jgi:nitronate monooxygenase